MRVVEVIADGLARAGVPRIFAAGRDLSSPLLEAAAARGIALVPGGEGSTVVMAAVTGGLTGVPGVARVARGSGVLSSAAGVGHASFARAPMILLTGSQPEPGPARSPDDEGAMSALSVKQSLTVTAESASDRLARAVEAALAEPRGPVLLHVPDDAAQQSAVPPVVSLSPPPAALLDEAMLDRAGALIAAARRPLVIAGLGCRSSDGKWLRAFCEALPAPILTTYHAKGAVPDPHPLALGILAGETSDEVALSRADLIIALGLDPAELSRPIRSASIPVVSLARWPSWPPAGSASGTTPHHPAHSGERDRAPAAGVLTPAVEVVGDPGLMLEGLAPRLRVAAADWDVAEIDRLRRQRREVLERPATGLAPHRVIQLARECSPTGSIATADATAPVVPAIGAWQATEIGELLIPAGPAGRLAASPPTTGFAVPAAVAAQLAFPGRRVFCFTGHGEWARGSADRETLAALGLPITAVVLDGRDESAALGRALGIASWTAMDERSLIDAMLRAERHQGPTLIAAIANPPGGASATAGA